MERVPLLDSTLHVPVLQDAPVAIFATSEAPAATSEEDASEGFNDEEQSSSDGSADDKSDSSEEPPVSRTQ